MQDLEVAGTLDGPCPFPLLASHRILAEHLIEDIPESPLLGVLLKSLFNVRTHGRRTGGFCVGSQLGSYGDR